MYADDLILLSASVNGLQTMLNCCISTSKELIRNFNCCKSSCTAIGQGSSYVNSDMQLGFSNISWSSSFKYLWVTFIVEKNLSVNINIVKRKFYSACNFILRKTCYLNEIMRLNLQESFCLPVLQYAMAAVRLSKLKYLNWMRAGNRCSDIFLVSQRANQLEHLYLVWG